jgi:hypothetical protein
MALSSLLVCDLFAQQPLKTTGATVGALGGRMERGEQRRNGKLCLSPKIRPLVPKQ